MLIVSVLYFTYLKPNISRKVFNMLTWRQQQLKKVGRQQTSEMSLEQFDIFKAVGRLLEKGSKRWVR